MHGQSLKDLALTYKDSFLGIICLLSWSELLPSSSAGLRGFGRSLHPLLSGERVLNPLTRAVVDLRVLRLFSGEDCGAAGVGSGMCFPIWREFEE